MSSEDFMYIKIIITKQLQGTSRNNHRIYELKGTLEKKEGYNSSNSSKHKTHSQV